jgi:hypothetical protein
MISLKNNGLVFKKHFQKSWSKLANVKRIIVHIPSLGYSEQIRANMKDLAFRENFQMAARLADIIGTLYSK